MPYDLRIIDGQKSVRLEDLPPEAFTILTGTDGGGNLKKLFEAVPWLYRGVTVRANAMAKMPFTIFKGETEIDNSANYQNTVGFWPNPTKTLMLLETSLTMTGRAYLHKLRNAFVIKDLRYLVPTTIKPKLDKFEGLAGFDRRVGGTPIFIPVDDMVWFWYPDFSVELGPPDSSPALVASRAAGVLFNIDTFVEGFFERGAVKTSILAVPRNAQESERARLKSFWTRLGSGIKNAWTSLVLNVDEVKVVTIGEGISELANTDLTDEKREDISTALGVPQTLLFSDATNFATAKQDDFNLYDKTINPESEFIESVLNELLFIPLGFQIKFHQEALQATQEEEVDRSAALVNLERAGVPTWLGMAILGFDLPPGFEKEDIEIAIRNYLEFKSELRLPLGAASDLAPQSSGGQRSIFDEYQRHAIKALRAGKKIKGTEDAPPFVFNDYVSKTQSAILGGALSAAKTVDDIKRIFQDVREWDNYP